ncbi:anaerobic ribonucleoside-triphosphate reductase activating protein [Burkholderia thailandensis]|uniref:Radical SAM domain protein n=1 Tax=Burkholderia thailandensis (strain ATCC 700388 / DSM 13276 / CCUG 48851 / CIP 106301 / E264) TaxID=271848 RepID=Q2SXK9_BURTA|nr:anaerobic ribonucleoside-triphosphate reductase activating protein [Burkholderia thailandensis]ABC37906.1 radical SAM domain protein [Burkholderia thailandensis E264]AHI73595.1 anaerobic ribonucleoside-triphosphate reductase activating protein [Burkholderia thailandensis 2002721723]AHI80528.1 anaerobic ribonucleoside-triphosphate reductase activating protein [Burkholderia thailandensis E444]AIC86924.1 anaerobic ribonucleoside-triphosphate reductase activating protein [Burkholderia thailanden
MNLALPRRHPLKVGGLVPFTATDYPGQLAAVVFVQGCPWRCGYCHNPHLQPRSRPAEIEWDALLAFLARRVGLIDAVVFSGGEPSIDPALAAAIDDVRRLGFKVGMHSAGTHPRRLSRLLPSLDWIGLDVKAPFDDYTRTTRVRASGGHARQSLEAVLASGIAYECRTTAHPDLLPEPALLRIAHELADLGVERYVLQVFRTQGCGDGALNAASLAGYPSNAVLGQLDRLFADFAIRRG